MKVSMMRLLILFVLLSFTALAQATPDIKHWQTEKGLRVYYEQSPELPMLDIRLVFDAGSARDGDKPGLASLTSGQIFNGTKEMGLETIAERLDDVGAVYGSGSLRDMAWIKLRTVTRKESQPQALDTFLKVLAGPSFPQKDFARAQKQALISLKAEEQSPAQIASKAFYKAVYGDHPYASPVSGTPESVAAISRQDLADFYQRYYVASNAILVIVGDIDEAGAHELAQRIDAVLEPGEKAPDLPPVPELKEAKKVYIPFPSEQAHVFIGQPGMLRGDKDYFPLYVGNHVLGGSGFTSRLVKEIRSKRGLAYSVYSYFLPMHVKGPFMAGLQTKVDQTDEAVDLVFDTIKKYREEGPTEKELKASKQNITGGFPLRVASNSDRVDYLGLIGFYQLSLNYLDEFTPQVEAVTAKQIRDAWQRRIHPERMVTVIVGGEGK
jgi:zinc protease